MGVFKPNNVRKIYKSIYWCWKAMKQRCQNPRCQAYRNYGARGITVCGEWQEFEPFLEWCLANGYQKGLELDRINNDGNYEPSNCRWTTTKTNVNNRRMTVMITVDGTEKSAAEWGEHLNINRHIITYWVRNHGKQYAVSRIKEVIKNGYVPNDYGYSHRKQIRHESGRTFCSVRECAEAFGLAPCTISNAIREGRKTTRGRFEYV